MLYGINPAFYYNMQFVLKEYHHYSVEEYENLVPFERDIIISLVNEKIENEKLQQQQQGNN